MFGFIRAFATTAVNPWLILTILTAITGAGGWGYLQGREDGANAVLAKVETRRETVQRTQALALQAVAKAVAAIEVKNTYVKQAVEREIVERPIYRDGTCNHTDLQLQRLNAAITGDDWAEPAGDRQLPPADSTDQPRFRGNNPQTHRNSRTISPLPSGDRS